MARKPKDYRAELETLQDKARELKARHTVELGRIVQATGADLLDLEVLAGILVSGVKEAQDEKAREAWRTDGARFFLKRDRRKASRDNHSDDGVGQAQRSGAPEG